MASLTSVGVSHSECGALHLAAVQAPRPEGSQCKVNAFFGRKLQSIPRQTKAGRKVQASPATRTVALAAASPVPPTVADTKSAFLNAYKKPIPSLYSNAIQELIVQHHLVRYNQAYSYDAIMALGFVTIYDQLMDGLPPKAGSSVDIFKAYVGALRENPEQYRSDASALEEWASQQDSTSVINFAERSGKVDGWLKEVSAKASDKNKFCYSRFFAVGLFRIVELAKASDPSVLEKLCAALNISKLSVDRDLDVYRALLKKLTSAKELLADFLEREKKKQAEREATKAATAA